MDLTSALSNISDGSRQKRKRVGRGTGSGTGKTAGRGHKGQNSRTGGGVRLGFEGGQTPLFRRIKKRGFNNFNRVEYQVVNVAKLNDLTENEITIDVLKAHNLVSKLNQPVKILGNGELTKKVNVEVHKVSASAVSQIEKLGGKVTLLTKEEE
jgi:large subunit ribosomal protein L15